MSALSIVTYLSPWRFRRRAEAERVAALRNRDGDNCARCRRPMHFGLPAGHDQGVVVEQVTPGAAGESLALENLRLCHPRCNPSGIDHTVEVTERARRKNEAALFAKARTQRAA